MRMGKFSETWDKGRIDSTQSSIDTMYAGYPLCYFKIVLGTPNIIKLTTQRTPLTNKRIHQKPLKMAPKKPQKHLAVLSYTGTYTVDCRTLNVWSHCIPLIVYGIWIHIYWLYSLMNMETHINPFNASWIGLGQK